MTEPCGNVYTPQGDLIGWCDILRPDDGTPEGGDHPGPHNIGWGTGVVTP